jgi:hypothetical protein
LSFPRHLGAISIGFAPASARFALPLFSTVLFLSAFLLFGVEPMFTKMALPVLGGAPAVWSVAMAFFQGVLLAAYVYAHALTRLDNVRLAALIHLGTMVAALFAMPIALNTHWGRPPNSGEAFWLLSVFTTSIGLPFFAVAANGPLLQVWFARTGHPHAKDPYFLYGASNIGSFAALVAYPFVVEPILPLKLQSLAWTNGFLALAILIVLCAAVATRSDGANAANSAGRRSHAPSQAASPAALWRQRLSWIGLSAVPSGLLLAVTAHISTDVAAVPLLWVAPLALYLLTFVIAFRERPIPGHAALPLALIVLVAAGWTADEANLSLVARIFVYLGIFTVAAFSAHATLYTRRPGVERLTEFYVCISFGGMLGGVFCGLVAPHVFSTVVEYPLLVAAAFFCRPDIFAKWRERWVRDIIVVLCCWIASMVAAAALTATVIDPASGRAVQIMLMSGLALLSRRHPLRAALCGLAMTTVTLTSAVRSDDGIAMRSFFGVNRIFNSSDGRFRLLMHGTTIHGAMRIREDDGSAVVGAPKPLTYYSAGGSISDAIEAVRSGRGGLHNVSVLGLGAGSLACVRRPGETWSFREIDSVVVEIARNPIYFRFMSDCGADIPVVLGDARLTLADVNEPQSAIVVDAFSSDSIPVHLLTTEAMALSASKLEPNGALIYHITNRNLELKNIVARVAAENGLTAYFRADKPSREATQKELFAPSAVVAVTRDVQGVGRSLASKGWSQMTADMTRRPWSDDYSNILEAIVDRWASPRFER